MSAARLTSLLESLVGKESTAGAWQPYRGPLGGHGWIHEGSGEVAYQSEYPGVTDEGAENLQPAARRAVEDMEPEGVAEAAAGELGVEPEELLEGTQHGATNRPPQPEEVARVALEEAQEKDESTMLGLLETLAGAGGESEKADIWVGGDDAPGDLNFDEPVIRVWVDSAEDAPPGVATHRHSGLHYYDVPVGALRAVREPRSFVCLDAFGSSSEAPGLPPAWAEKSWVPYEGPQGGNGWRNTDTGDVVYQDEPPGEVAGPMDIREAAEEAGLSEEQTEELLDRARESLRDAGDGIDVGRGGIGDVVEISEQLADAGIPDPADPDDVVEAWERSDREGGPPEWVRDGASREDLAMAISTSPSGPPPGSDNVFDGVDADVPGPMDPANADSVGSLEDKYGDGGRSSSSMWVADGVPDEDGNERRLFVTNLNPERGDHQGRYSGGERTMAANAGLREAGVPAPRAAKADGEYWVTEELEGRPASRAKHLDISDDPEDVKWEMAEMMSAAFATGTWDVHGDNVFVTDEGELAVVDSDLAGASLSADANQFDNPMSVSQRDAWERFRGLWESLDMDRQNEVTWEETVDATIDRFEQRNRDGEIADIVSAASGATDNLDVQTTIEENKFQADGFFDGMRETAYEVSPW